MTATFTTVANVLKRKYPQRKVTASLFKDAPLLAWMKKNESWTGSTLDISVQYSNTGGGSATFTNAQGNKNPNQYERFQVDDVTDYSLFSITTRALRACGNDAGALVRKVDQEMKGAMNTIRRSCATGVYRNHGGALGRISSGGGTATITLTDRAEITNFEPGYMLVSDPTDGSSGGSDDGFPVRMTGISRSGGTITAAAAWNAGGGFADNSYLFRQGDFGLKMRGLESWIPLVAPTSGDSHFGVDRSVDVERLAGHRYVATEAADGTILNAVRRACNQQSWLGGSPTHAFCHPMAFDDVEQELGDRIVFDKLSARPGKSARGMAEMFFKTIVIMTANGEVRLTADRDCPLGRVYLLDEDCWTLHSRGPLAGWLDDDGKGKTLREGAADSMEGRLGSFHNVACDNPGSSGVVDISALVTAL